MDTVVKLLCWINTGFGIGLVYFNVMFYVRYKTLEFRWVKACYAILGGFWGLINFLFVTELVKPHIFESYLIPAVTFTMGIMLAGAVLRVRSLPK